MSQNNPPTASGSQGSGFWDKNGSTIMSTAGAVLSTGYKTTKYVAKTGYSAGKKHYESQKLKREGGVAAPDDSVEPEESFTPPTTLKDPKSFAPPPLRTGQKQYQSDGKIIEASEAPISNISPRPTFQGAAPTMERMPVSSPSLNFPPATVTPGIPGMLPLYNTEGVVIGYVPAVASQPASQPATPSPLQSQPPPVATRNTVTVETPPQATNDATSQRPAALLPGQAPSQPSAPELPISNEPTNHIAPDVNASDRAVPLPPSVPMSSAMSPDSTGTSGVSVIKKEGTPPTFHVTPYEFVEPEKRAEEKRIAMQKVDITQFAPPPSHSGKAAIPGPKLSELIEDKQKGRLSNESTGRKSSTPPATPAKLTGQRTNSSLHSGTQSSVSSPSEAENVSKSGITGKYDYNASVKYAPPTRPHNPNAEAKRTIPSPPARSSSTSTTESAEPQLPAYTAFPTGQHTPPAVTRRHTAELPSSSGAPPVEHRPLPSTATKPPTIAVRKTVSDTPEVRSDVLKGGYDYHKTVSYAPPPRPHRNAQDIENAEAKKNRVTTDRYSKMAAETPYRIKPAPAPSHSPSNSLPHSNQHRIMTALPPVAMPYTEAVPPPQVASASPPLYTPRVQPTLPVKKELPALKSESPPIIKAKPLALSKSSGPPPKPSKPVYLSEKSSSEEIDYSAMAKDKAKKKVPPPKPKKKKELNYVPATAETPPNADYNPFSVYSKDSVPREYNHMQTPK